MTINRFTRLCQRTAIWIAAVWLGPMSVSAAAEEKAAFPVATPVKARLLGCGRAPSGRRGGRVREERHDSRRRATDNQEPAKTILHEVTERAIAKTNEPWKAARSSTSAR